MVFGKKKKTSKNKVKDFIDGKEVPDKIPKLDIPVPPVDEMQPLKAEDVFQEGRSVGWQEGMIYALSTLQEHLHKKQDELRKEQK